MVIILITYTYVYYTKLHTKRIEYNDLNDLVDILKND